MSPTDPLPENTGRQRLRRARPFNAIPPGSQTVDQRHPAVRPGGWGGCDKAPLVRGFRRWAILGSNQ